MALCPADEDLDGLGGGELLQGLDEVLGIVGGLVRAPAPADPPVVGPEPLEPLGNLDHEQAVAEQHDLRVPGGRLVLGDQLVPRVGEGVHQVRDLGRALQPVPARVLLAADGGGPPEVGRGGG
ncbi:hypothetical protein HMPREF3105_07145 [Micrococcus sp. HMSC31B01]|nr:hypothetical protein HMPREF3105_07145 [Micrococcus sp. HMSC31B01]